MDAASGVDETVKAVSDLTMDATAGETSSKNARKRELKNKQREEERRRKEEEKAAKQAAAKPGPHVQKSVAADDEEMDPTVYTYACSDIGFVLTITFWV
uniref:Uncharacterized protein MANES_07G091500 n=1 Tax=Rhizophora mucronata TaxID=61149 RepID=A0A2P2KDD5_RHIMU